MWWKDELPGQRISYLNWLCVYSWTEVPLGWRPPRQPSLDSKLNQREKDSPFVLPWCPELHTQVGSLNLLLGTEGQMFLALWCK